MKIEAQPQIIFLIPQPIIRFLGSASRNNYILPCQEVSPPSPTTSNHMGFQCRVQGFLFILVAS
jgi:hypothetical protein